MTNPLIDLALPYLANQVFIHWLRVSGSVSVAMIVTALYWVHLYRIHAILSAYVEWARSNR